MDRYAHGTAIAAVIESAGSPEGAPDDELEKLRSILGLKGFFITDSAGNTVRSSSSSWTPGMMPPAGSTGTISFCVTGMSR